MARPDVLGKIGEKDLREYLEICARFQSVDVEKVQALTMGEKKRISSGSKERQGEGKGLDALERKWYESLAKGKPDYSVYGDPLYLAEVWLCWVIYSREYLKSIAAKDIYKSKPPESLLQPRVVLDLGCGFGYSTAALKGIYPKAEVIGTNLKGTAQWAVASHIGKQHGFSLKEFSSKLRPDVVFASEYFEHFERPVEHLREVLETEPEALIVANTFGQKSIGHFDVYKDGDESMTGREVAKLFNSELVGAGYERIKTKCWNNRPSFWVRKQQAKSVGKGMKEKNFAVLILTHGRADKVYTVNTLRRHGYTGRIVIVIDNEDKQADAYRKRYKDQVQMFDKLKVAGSTDEVTNFGDRRSITFARNASFEIAKRLGIDTFIQLDDDYTNFNHRRNGDGEYCVKNIKNMDAVFDAMVRYFHSAPFLSIAMAQGGDFIGGSEGNAWESPKRKCMNSFICTVRRPFKFVGLMNEDVNTYTSLGSRGNLFLTVTSIALQQKPTQKTAGGITELYKERGTYVKSFYTVIVQPSSVKIAALRNQGNWRIHHQVRWRFTVPCILPETYKKKAPKKGGSK